MRETISLNGEWTFALDPHDQGLAENWASHGGFERTVGLPAPWQTYGPDTERYIGTAWYQRSLEVPEPWQGSDVRLIIEACDYETRVYLDGQELARHEGGYTPIEVTFPTFGRYHNLVLRVHDPVDNSEVPHGKQGSWYTRVSGPWQPVRLERRERNHVERLSIGVFPDRLELTVSPEDTSITILDPQGREVASRQGSGPIVLESPLLWTPDEPNLYTAVAALGQDRLQKTFGVRWVERKDGRIYLNGQRLFIRGMLDQGFWPQTVYLPPSVEAIENEIALAKQMGVNLLRKHIKLEDPRYLDACDRAGMLIWEEPPCFYRYTSEGRARFWNEVERMVDRDGHHPCIIAWSLYNEEWGLEWRLGRDLDKQEHVADLYQRAQILDPTRLWCDNSGWAHVTTDINDWHRYFVLPDQRREWEEDLDRCVTRPHDNFVAGRGEDVPLIISELGVWGLPEVSRILQGCEGRPSWFDARWAGHTEEFKYPATAERNFDRFALGRVFGDLDGLGRHCQQRMMRALKGVLETMRRRPELSGYVVTELTDIEWESNGWLDYFRNPKLGFEQFAWFNGPVAVMVELDNHAFALEKGTVARLWVSNHTSHSFTGEVRWSYGGQSGAVAVDVASHQTGQVAELNLPPGQGRHLDLQLFDGAGMVTNNREELFPLPAVTGSAQIQLRVPQLESALRTAGYALGDSGVIVTDSLPLATLKELEEGATVLWLAERGDEIEAKAHIPFRRLPRGESWDRASSILFFEPGWWDDVLPGWELEGLYPQAVIPLAGYMHDFGGRSIELPGLTNLDPNVVKSGYFEGWLGKFAGATLNMPVGRGRLLVTTWRILENYERQPAAALMLSRLLERLG
jgi:hypothetical protein